MPTPAQAAEYDLEETAEWLMANLCADLRCRGDRPYRYSITRLNKVEIVACVMTLQYTGDRRPATIPLRDVWQIDLRSPSQDDATVAIRWHADPERDAWYLEDRNAKTETAGWLAEPGSAIFILNILGSRAQADGDGVALMLNRIADLCLN